MKILELRFKNLNSLYGEWVVDFTDPEYTANGLFSLTGPTGAGKSTILDAICLALYGATPRLGRITKSGNEIMSRQTGECYAEVLFESQAGRFRCHWEQRRARKKSDGKLQEQEHWISDAQTGRAIESKKSRVGDVIEDKTGMDFDRFTRSILLAQGGFDTFLKADVEQKSKILEQITGTEIYSEISRRVHERHRDERNKLEVLQAETAGIILLEPEREQEIQQGLEEKQALEKEQTNQFNETGQAITWRNNIAALESEISNLVIEAENQQAEQEAFKPEQEKLTLANQAATLEGAYATLCGLRRRQQDDRNALCSEQKNLPELQSAVNRQMEAQRIAAQQTQKIRQEMEEAAPQRQKVRSLDQTIADQVKSIADISTRCHADSKQIDANEALCKEEQGKRVDAERQLAEIANYLNEQAQDEWLISGFAGIKVQFTRLIEQQAAITQKTTDVKNTKADLKKAETQVQTATAQRELQKQALHKAEKNLQQGQTELDTLLDGKLLREYHTEKETLQREMRYLDRIAKLEDYRAKLEDGQPCPLCGSKEHPFAEGNIPAPDATEAKIEQLNQRITQVEDQQTTIQSLEKTKTGAHQQLSTCEHQVTLAEQTRQNTEKELSQLNTGLTELQTDSENLKQQVSEALQPLGVTELPEQAFTLLASLTQRLQRWQGQASKKVALEQQIADIGSEIGRINAVITTQRDALTKLQEQLAQMNTQHVKAKKERYALYGDKDPDKEEVRLTQCLNSAEQTENIAKDRCNELGQTLTKAQAHVEWLEQQIEQMKPELETAETEFLNALSTVGFPDEHYFLKVKLNSEERGSLSARAEQLAKAKTELNARQKDRQTRLETEIARQVTDKPREALELESKRIETALNELRNEVASLKHRLSENIAAKTRIAEKKAAIDQQKQECQRWDQLHGLIGSSDGKKYRNFAQGLTFELMVSHANRQLEKMTDRYLLIRDDTQPLELNVIDNYQAGEIRSTRNLSGGESFMVSLTLALGLSKMSSRKVRVDSLFLDEGFGTLDEESLETALDTLASLHEEQKLIGVISHVSALKERIATQILIQPQHSGRSFVSGPGCSRG